MLEQDPSDFSAIIIAAGLSSRMGAFKPLLPLGDKSALEHCTQLFEHLGISTIVVTGHRHQDIEDALTDSACSVVHNNAYQEGMFSSITCGIQNLPPCKGFFLLPVDIPLIRAATVKELISAFYKHPEKILIPTCETEEGHPPLIPSRYISEILNYNGEGGLRALFSRLPLERIAIWDEHSLLDMDRQEDYDALQGRIHTMQVGTRQEAAIIARQYMPDKGVVHGEKVAEVALILAQHLPKNGLDLDLIHNAALLHDIAKGTPHHEAEGGKLVIELGLSGLHDAIACHQTMPVPEDHFTETHLVCLADKIVQGGKIVPLKSRFERKMEIFGENPDAARNITMRMQNALDTVALYERIADITIAQLFPETL